MPSVKDQVNFQSRFNINANGENKLKGGTLDRNGGSKGTGILTMKTKEELNALKEEVAKVSGGVLSGFYKVELERSPE